MALVDASGNVGRFVLQFRSLPLQGRKLMLQTRLTKLLGLDYPIINASMARMSGGRLAGAVSAAGGLGTFAGIAFARATGPDYVREQIGEIRARTDRAFGVGFVTHWLPQATGPVAGISDDTVRTR